MTKPFKTSARRRPHGDELIAITDASSCTCGHSYGQHRAVAATARGTVPSTAYHIRDDWHDNHIDRNGGHTDEQHRQGAQG